MPKQQKIDVVNNIAEKLVKAKGIYFTDYLGLNVSDITELRKQFHENGVEFCVVKNTLAKFSVEKAGLDMLDGVFEGPTAIAFSYEDGISPARVLNDFNKTHDLPELKAFVFEGKVMDRSSFKQIAKLPSREVLLTRLIGGLSSPMLKFTSTLRSPLSNLTNVLNSLKETKQS